MTLAGTRADILLLEQGCLGQQDFYDKHQELVIESDWNKNTMHSII
mgnify:FL=1